MYWWFWGVEELDEDEMDESNGLGSDGERQDIGWSWFEGSSGTWRKRVDDAGCGKGGLESRAVAEGLAEQEWQRQTVQGW